MEKHFTKTFANFFCLCHRVPQYLRPTSCDRSTTGHDRLRLYTTVYECPRLTMTFTTVYDRPRSSTTIYGPLQTVYDYNETIFREGRLTFHLRLLCPPEDMQGKAGLWFLFLMSLPSSWTYAYVTTRRNLLGDWVLNNSFTHAHLRYTLIVWHDGFF